MIFVKIICVGKIKEKYLEDAIKEYSKRLSRFCKLEIVELPDEKIPDKISDSVAEQVKVKEGIKILDNIKNGEYVICLDPAGKEMNSIEFSNLNTKIINRGYGSITYIIGGSLGIGNNVLERSQEKISFSKLTFPHQLFRVIFLEQLYRNFKIANNEKYHK